MAIEIVGECEYSIEKYRRHLHERGQFTKRMAHDLKKETGVDILAEKPEGFRLLAGTMKAIKAPGQVDNNDFKFDPDKKLFIAGIANANIVDRMDERLEPAGIEIENFMKNKVLLADHMYLTMSTIGRLLEIRAEDSGVHFDAFIGDPSSAPLTALQTDIRSLVAQGLLQTVSVGFIPKKIQAPTFDQETGKLLTPAIILIWELLELSIVAVPANPGATFEMRHYAKMLGAVQQTQANPAKIVIPSTWIYKAAQAYTNTKNEKFIEVDLFSGTKIHKILSADKTTKLVTLDGNSLNAIDQKELTKLTIPEKGVKNRTKQTEILYEDEDDIWGYFFGSTLFTQETSEQRSERGAKESLLKINEEEGVEVHELTFDQEMFTLKEAKQWAEEHNFKADKTLIGDETITLSQRTVEDFHEDTFKSVIITDGVKATIGSLKKGHDDMDQKTAEELVEAVKANTTQLGSLAENVKTSIGIQETILSTVQAAAKAKAGDKPDEEEDDKDKDKDKDKTGDGDGDKSVADQLASMKTTVDQLAVVVEGMYAKTQQ